MAKIRKLKFHDIPKLKKMISMISDTDSKDLGFGFKSFVPFPLNWLHDLLPLSLKFLSESFVSISDNKINGMITLKAQHGNPRCWKICNLFLTENSYDAGSQLIGYATAKYGAMGANTFTVRIDTDLDELMELFSKGCGFRMCSSEQIFKAQNADFSNPSLAKGFFRPFKNEDSKAVKNLHNDSIYPHFRYSLAKTDKEFNNLFFSGLSKTSYFKFVLEENGSIKGFCCIQTDDNVNFLLDIDLVQGYDDCFFDLIKFAWGQIKLRKENFNFFVLNKKYRVSGAKFEEKLLKSGFKCVKTQAVMVKDYYKKIQEEQRSQKPAIVFSDISRKPAFNVREV